MKQKQVNETELVLWEKINKIDKLLTKITKDGEKTSKLIKLKMKMGTLQQIARKFKEY